jgi:DNA gyrase/topoisomerase IV subunit A
LNIETNKNGKESIIIYELPYQVNKAVLHQKIAHLVNDKVIEGVSDVRDESDRDGMRLVVDLKKDAIAQCDCKSVVQVYTNCKRHLVSIMWHWSMDVLVF